MKSNKKLGSDFEQEVCKILADHGFWVHNFANRSNGQPVDIIAVHMDYVMIADAKVCSKGYFETRRLEENQVLAIRKWFECGNKDVELFFLLPDESVYSMWISNKEELDKVLAVKRIPEKVIRQQHCWREGVQHETV